MALPRRKTRPGRTPSISTRRPSGSWISIGASRGIPRSATASLSSVKPPVTTTVSRASVATPAAGRSPAPPVAPAPRLPPPQLATGGGVPHLGPLVSVLAVLARHLQVPVAQVLVEGGQPDRERDDA